MFKNRYILIITALIGLTSTTFIKMNPKFSYKVYGNVANYFENENDMFNFFEFKKGETIAEIGAFDGQNIGGFSILIDSTTFYAQDIDSVNLTLKKFDKLIKHSQKHKKTITNTFHVCIGTEKSTNLPDYTFDKIFLISTFHEFNYLDEMMTDIYRKLKPSGKLYILETRCLSHNNYKTADETITLLKKYNFNLVKKNGKDINNSSGLFRVVFSKV